MIKTLTITKAREELPTLVEKAEKLFDEYIITVRGVPKAILMSTAEYESWRETLEILSDEGLMKAIRQGEEDVRRGRVYDLDDVVKELGFDVPSKNNRKSKKRT